MQFLPRFSSIAGRNQFPTTDFKMQYSQRFSSTAEKFVASTNSSYYEKEDIINEKEDKISEKEDKINEKEDKISELPQNIIDHIFDRMPIRDAARTTILSRKWRHVWASHPKLVFDDNFFREILIRHEQSIQYEFTKAISKALSFHGGPIFTFILHIPNIPNMIPEIDQWMLFLSRNGIKELEIHNSSLTPYIVPRCIFSCSLSSLKLQNCRLKPPHNDIEGLQYLVSLELVRVLFCATMSATLLQNTPMLKKLAIINCTGIQHIDWRWVANKKLLKYVRIELGGMEVKNVEPTANMMEFLKDIPKVGELYLNGYSLEYLGTSNPHKHQDLSITHIAIRDLLVDQIPFLFCLLKHCPNLISLQLKMGASGRRNNVKELVAEYLEQSNWLDVNLEMLQTVSIEIMKGDKVELLLIKLLLEHSTCLKRMVIQRCTFRDSVDISGQLQSFPRASSSLEIIRDELDFAAIESLLSGEGEFIYPLCFAFVAAFLFQVFSQLF